MSYDEECATVACCACQHEAVDRHLNRHRTVDQVGLSVPSV
eukprot:COSAG02_NODE_742_length_17794_cov_22.222718_14_plen_41_part_00